MHSAKATLALTVALLVVLASASADEQQEKRAWNGVRVWGKRAWESRVRLWGKRSVQLEDPSLQHLVQQLFTTYDTNGDEVLSVDEFGSLVASELSMVSSSNNQ